RCLRVRHGFFFQAEDGIRAFHVTGVQTCALPISWSDDVNFDPSNGRGAPDASGNLNKPDYTIGQKAFALHNVQVRYVTPSEQLRSEERRVGKECSSRQSQNQHVSNRMSTCLCVGR